MWVRKWLSDKKRERYGHYSTLLTELRTEDGKAFYTYTRLPRGLYDDDMNHELEAMLLPSFSWLSHHQSMPFCMN
jgi:hypothetical protein